MVMWEAELLRDLNLKTPGELQGFLATIMADKRVMDAALRVGWGDVMMGGWGFKYSPGAFRRWKLHLPVYQADYLQADRWDEAHDSPTGIRFLDWRVFDFLRARLTGMYLSETGSSTALNALLSHTTRTHTL